MLTVFVSSLTPLAYFLQTSMLSTDTESGQDGASTPVSLYFRTSMQMKG